MARMYRGNQDWADDDTYDDSHPVGSGYGGGSQGGYQHHGGYGKSHGYGHGSSFDQYQRRGYDDFNHGGGYDNRGSGNYEREKNPIPENPPFTAFVGNVPYTTSEQDVDSLFSRCGTISDIRLTRYRDSERVKGVFVEFESKDALQQAIGLDGEFVSGRPIRVDVAVDRRDRGPRGGGGFRGGHNGSRGFPGYANGSEQQRWSHGGYNDKPRGYRSGGGDEHRPRGGYHNESRSAPIMDEPSEVSLEGRQKLQLKPRSVATEKSADGEVGSKSSIFGGARPIDTTEKLAEVEAKAADERQKVAEEMKAETSEEMEKREAQRFPEPTSNDFKGGKFGPGPGGRPSYNRRGGYARRGGYRQKGDRYAGGNRYGGDFVTASGPPARMPDESNEEATPTVSVNAFSLLQVDDDANQ